MLAPKFFNRLVSEKKYLPLASIPPVRNTLLYALKVNEFLFLPPNQGSVNEKLYDWYARPFDCTRMLSFWPSPVGNGSHAFLLKIFLIEKLLNVTPNVPVNPIPPPQPALSSSWSEDFSSTV